MFFLIANTILILAYGYIGIRMLGRPSLRNKFMLVLWLVLVSCLLIPGLSYWARSRDAHSLATISGWYAFLSTGYLSLVFWLLLINDTIKSLYLKVSASRKRSVSAGTDSGVISRRSLLSAGNRIAIAGTALAATGWGLYEARRSPRIKRIQIALLGLPPAFHRFRIVQISDIHLGPTIKRSFLASVVAQVNTLQPDMIVNTGDFVDGSVDWLGFHAEPLANLKAPHGTWFVTGNHEYYSGVEQWLEFLPSLGHKILLNDSAWIEQGGQRILLAGVTDYRAGSHSPSHKSDPERALRTSRAASQRTNEPRILLAHQPKSIIEADKWGVELQLSGHTHGGQYWPHNLFVGLSQPYIKGLHRHGNSQLYINTGTGYWGPPLRGGVPSEITLIELVSPEKV